MTGVSYTITLGGWFQRTTLHLTEIYDFFDRAYTKLPLSKSKLGELYEGLEFVFVERKSGYLEYIIAKTESGIEIKYYEDGLYTLKLTSTNVDTAIKTLKSYFSKKFNPAINYIFSLGAPTPKILANIKQEQPLVICTTNNNRKFYKPDEKIFGRVYSSIKTAIATIYKTPFNIFIVFDEPSNQTSELLLENQIFFREFKDQLEKYLNIHRMVWEEINEIKEKDNIRGAEIEKIRSKLDSYQKTINLISNRINQMDNYLNTRKNISALFKIDNYLYELFQYKFDTLLDTHKYIKELWKMTEDFLNSAIAVVVEMKSQLTNSNLKSLTIITTMGVMSGIIGYLSRDKIPQVTKWGFAYFVLLILVTTILNILTSEMFKRHKFRLRFSETKKFS